MYIKNYLVILHTRPKLTLNFSFGFALSRSKSRTTYEFADDGVCVCVCVCGVCAMEETRWSVGLFGCQL